MPHRPKQDSRVRIGDVVGYNSRFLDQHGFQYSDVGLARGEVLDLFALDSHTTLAIIKWNNPALPSRVNIRKLQTLKRPRIPLRFSAFHDDPSGDKNP
jgi:hypothetical protein